MNPFDKLKAKVEAKPEPLETSVVDKSMESMLDKSVEHEASLDMSIAPRDKREPEEIKSSLSAMMQKMKSKHLHIAEVEPEPDPDALPLYDKEGNRISLDSDQAFAVDKARYGQSFCLIGNAGTGKTTTNQAILLTWMQYHAHIITQIQYRIKGVGEYAEAPSVAVVSWTNQATDNMRKALLSNPTLEEWLGTGLNITTIHNLLEYSRDYVDVWDEETQETRSVMQYFPTRTAANPLNITHLVLEEGSLVAVMKDSGLWNQLQDALPPECQIIILGDISQLPPIGGKSILSYALLALPVVELKTIHRQALESPIIRQAYNVLSGKSIQTDLLPNGEGVEVLHGSSKTKTGIFRFKQALAKALPNFIELGKFVLGDSIILSPYNKLKDEHIGAQHMNNIIGTYLARKADREVYEIIAGIATIYLSVGDHVLYNKQKAIVTDISINPKFVGKLPMPASKTLDYWGMDAKAEDLHDDILDSLDSIDLADVLNIDYSNLDVDSDPKKLTERAASHTIKLHIDGIGELEVNTAGALGAENFYLAYALTVHKAQGSEWDNVIFVVHDSNASALYREMLYTGMTRPKKKLIVLGQQHVIDKMIKSPRIKGNSLQDKIAFFNGTGYLDQEVNIPTGYNLGDNQ